jgi:hypothetical protein
MAAQPDFDDEFEFPDEKEVNIVGKESDVNIEVDGDNIEVDIVDDTPPQDRDRKPLPNEIVEDLDKDD